MEKKRTDWSHQDTINLIEVWRASIDGLRKQKRHKSVYDKMQRDLEILGTTKNVQEIKSKIKNLQSKYRDEKKKIGPSGGSPSSWQYYEEIHAFIGSLPANDDTLIDEGILSEQAPGPSSSASESQDRHNNLDEGDEGNDEEGNNTSSQRISMRRPEKKRRIGAIQEDLLAEIKRANNASEELNKESNELLKKSNEIAEKQFDLTQRFFDRFM